MTPITITLETIMSNAAYSVKIEPSNTPPPTDYVWGRIAAGQRLAWCNVTVTARIGECEARTTAHDLSFSNEAAMLGSDTYRILCKLAAAKIAKSLNDLLTAERPLAQ